MIPEDWISHLQDSATNYFVEDVALSLVGDDLNTVDASTPVLLLKVTHVETDMRFTFTFTMSVETAHSLASVFDSMSNDLFELGGVQFGSLEGEIINNDEERE